MTIINKKIILFCLNLHAPIATTNTPTKEIESLAHKRIRDENEKQDTKIPKTEGFLESSSLQNSPKIENTDITPQESLENTTENEKTEAKTSQKEPETLTTEEIIYSEEDIEFLNLIAPYKKDELELAFNNLKKFLDRPYEHNTQEFSDAVFNVLKQIPCRTNTENFSFDFVEKVKFAIEKIPKKITPEIQLSYFFQLDYDHEAVSEYEKIKGNTFKEVCFLIKKMLNMKKRGILKENAKKALEAIYSLTAMSLSAISYLDDLMFGTFGKIEKYAYLLEDIMILPILHYLPDHFDDLTVLIANETKKLRHMFYLRKIIYKTMQSFAKEYAEIPNLE
ncbi:hypothetical protein [Alphaproteobacteria bacterium endosymbiont of Tiliacea citrago]|uniref:hypothetical protein n=1 Tax=Alphaproteobacteria bacterium endosymbiont of Tiliacea citrago TaxID=3077944 RepID=UPI00313C4347